MKLSRILKTSCLGIAIALASTYPIYKSHAETYRTKVYEKDGDTVYAPLTCYPPAGSGWVLTGYINAPAPSLCIW